METRICFVGDSITNGVGDGACLGWAGRLCAAEKARGHDVTIYNLGIRADTSALIRRRWRQECAARLPDEYAGALVFAFGVNDAALENGRPRATIDETIANVRAIVTEAVAWRPTLLVGPAPVEEAMNPIHFPPGPVREVWNRDVAVRSAAIAGVLAELGVAYLDLFARLRDDREWLAALRAGDGIHPAAEGYALMASVIGAWPGWRDWFDR